VGGTKGEKPKLILENGLRHDGRRPDELRPIKMQVGVLKNANGSAYVEFGKTSMICPGKFVCKSYRPDHTQPEISQMHQAEIISFSAAENKAAVKLFSPNHADNGTGHGLL